MPQQISTNTFGCAEWIVSSDATQGTHTTIQAAINAASSGDSVFIRTGTYTENLTLKAGVDLTAFGCDSSINATGHVIILGTCTLTTAGSVTISGIQLQTNSAALLAVTGSAASVVNLENCYLNITNSTGITFSSSSASAAINVNNTNGNLGTTGIGIFTHTSAGTLFFYETDIDNSGASTTASTASSGSLFIRRSAFNSPITTSSTNNCSFYTSQIYTQPQNVTAFTCGGSGTNVAANSIFQAGTASAVSVSTGSTLGAFLCTASSSNTNAITGVGTLSYSCIAFGGTSSTINTTTTNGMYTGLAKYRARKQPSFLAQRSATVNDVTGNGTVYTVIFDTEIYDQDSNYNNTTGVFTAPETGIYQFNVCVSITDLGAGHTAGNIILVTSNRSYVIDAGNAANMRNSANTLTFNGSVMADMDAADTASVTLTVANSTLTVDLVGGTSNTYFSGQLVA